ncbi:MAG: hypothetical protein NC318_00295 [Blautia sp.]|nr:hypothetical protein [Lachnoclostridium sp.]MCM1210026.1 hypothetical protein [Blautia sp.]
MSEKSKVIFGNPMADKVYKKAVRSKQKYAKKFGDDSNVDYAVGIEKNAHIGDSLGVRNVLLKEAGQGGAAGKDVTAGKNVATSKDATAAKNVETGKDAAVGSDGTVKTAEVFDTEKGIIVGNIRMGFGHYRISMAIASAAKSMGYVPYWMDLNSYKQTTCTKVISAQNDLYSLGSRLSGKSRLFNKFVWEPMNYEGFRKLSYNASDQKNAELMAPVYRNVPKDIPVVATHVWPAQAAIHAGMKYVVNAIPDNWPMALHLAEGSLHTVQTHFAYQGYRILNGMQGKDVLEPMPEEALAYTGHYIDHELVCNIEEDCARRMKRKADKKPMRFLLTIGGAGAQKEIFAAIIKYLIPRIRENKAALYVNVGDYRNVWEELVKEIPGLREVSTEHFNQWEDTQKFAEAALDGDIEGVHAFWHENIFEAVYCTNLLMRSCDVLVTKPSELAFYPVPKLFIKRVGGHEQWGAIHSAEIGDGTLECRDTPHTLQMIKLFIKEESLLKDMCENIIRNKADGIYDGAYKVIRLAMEKRSER